jgi:hypothetical protein
VVELTERDREIVQRVVNMLKNASGPGVRMGGDTLSVHAPPAPPGLRPPGEKWRWLRITSAATGGGLYNARHQKVTSGPMENPSTDFNAANFFADVNTSADDCLFRNLSESGTGSHTLPVDGSYYVLARRAPIDTTDSPAKPVYEANIGGGISKGQYEYQGFFMVSQNQTGWDYTRAHGMS